MAKPNYQFEKRQRDLAKKNKQEEKRQKKAADKLADGSTETSPDSDDEVVSPPDGETGAR